MAAPPQYPQYPPQQAGAPARPSMRDMDPALASIFDAMTTYMGSSYGSMSCTQTYDGTGARQTATCSYINSPNNWQYMEYNAGDRVSITPTNASVGPGGTQQFTATVTDPSGNPVASAAFTWSVQPGGLGTINQTGLYTAPATVAAAATDTVRCALNGSNSWATVTVNLRTS